MTIRIDRDIMITGREYDTLPLEYRYHYQLNWLYNDISSCNEEGFLIRSQHIREFIEVSKK